MPDAIGTIPSAAVCLWNRDGTIVRDAHLGDGPIDAVFKAIEKMTGISVELCVDAMELAGYIDQMVLFSGDADFRALVEAMQRRGVRVTVVSTVASQPMMIADELRRQADVFVDLAGLRPSIERQGSDRTALRELRFQRRNTASRTDGNGE